MSKGSLREHWTEKKQQLRDAAAVLKITFWRLLSEDNYSKEEILELYVNTSYFGDGYYGIKEACNGYLDKEPSEMDLNECTMMAGIPNAPSVYAPTKNPDLTKSRQEHVLETMVGNGYISQEEADEIINANT